MPNSGGVPAADRAGGARSEGRAGYRLEVCVEINLGEERIVELQSGLSTEQVQAKALACRVDAFGSVAKLIQRPKAEDIGIATIQKRLEPFWYAEAVARYVYDRRHTYRIEVAPEVRSVAVFGNDLEASGERGRSFQLEGLEHCVEETRRELLLDAQHGDEVDLHKYLAYPERAVSDVTALSQGGTLVVAPEVRGSFVVRKLVSLLVKTFQADQIHEERIDVERIILYYRPIYAVEYLWKPKGKTKVFEFDGLTGDVKAEAGEIKRQVARVLENDTLFDIGADAIGTVLPGANLAVKLGRLAARKVVR